MLEFRHVLSTYRELTRTKYCIAIEGFIYLNTHIEKNCNYKSHEQCPISEV